MMLRRWSRGLVVSLALALTAACGSEPRNEVFGIYTLVGVEGSPLPYLASSDPECDEFIELGELVLVEAGTYSLEFSGPYDCSRGGGQTGTIGRTYSGVFSQSNGELSFQADVQGAGTLHFSGTANPLEAFVTVPPIPPAAGPDLRLQFAVVN